MQYSSNDLWDVSVHRFHVRKHLPNRPWKLLDFFMDGEFLAKQQGRFSGAYLNPGYYFSLKPETCVFEMLYYNRVSWPPSTQLPSVSDILRSTAGSGKERVFLSCEASFDNILNLFWPETLWSTLRKCFPNMQKPSAGVDSGTVLLELADTEMGGNLLTDVIGKYAYKSDYNGIRFPSARALESSRSTPGTAGSLRDGLRYGGVGDETYEFDNLMQNIHSKATNVVVFRGAYILQCVKRFKVHATDDTTPSDWQDNELWNVPEHEIERQVVENGGWCAEDVYSECSDFISEPNIQFGKRSDLGR
jgi:RES domain